MSFESVTVSSSRWDEQWMMQSFTDPTKDPYKISRTGEDYFCSCPAHKFRRSTHGDCKHIKALKKALRGHVKFSEDEETTIGEEGTPEMYRVITVPKGVKNVRAYNLATAMEQ